MLPQPPTIDPGHPHATTKHISFNLFKQASPPAPFGYEYFVSHPPAYTANPDRKWPLLLFLHGSGESQNNPHESYVTLRHGIPKIILCYDRHKSSMPPQIKIPRPGSTDIPTDGSAKPVPPEVCTLVAEEFITVTPSLDMNTGYGWNAAVLSALMDEVLEWNRVDLGRVHVTGFSMGGYGTWDLGIHAPGRFASLVPICGGGDTVLAGNIKHVPQWIHHGAKDKVIPIENSIKMEEALKKAGATDVRLTTYPDAGHDSWTEAYGNIDVFKWILGKERIDASEEKAIRDENRADVRGV